MQGTFWECADADFSTQVHFTSSNEDAAVAMAEIGVAAKDMPVWLGGQNEGCYEYQTHGDNILTFLKL